MQPLGILCFLSYIGANNYKFRRDLTRREGFFVLLDAV